MIKKKGTKLKENKSLVQASVINQYEMGKLSDNKAYPSIEVVRLEKIFFQKKRGSLLDYAIGGGCNAFHFMRLGYEVTGIDVTKKSLQMVRHFAKKNKLKEPNLFLLKKNSANLPFKDNSFDYVIAISVLSLLGSRSRIVNIFKEFKRVLKPNGKIIIDINDHDSDFSKNSKEIRKNVFSTNIHTKKVNCYCLKNAKDFEELAKPFFKIADTGYSSHKIFNRRIREFIICGINIK